MDLKKSYALIRSAADQGLSPFQASDIRVSRARGFGFEDYIEVRALNLPDHPYQRSVYELFVRFPRYFSLDDLAVPLAEEVFHHFRNIPRVEPPDNIILGED